MQLEHTFSVPATIDVVWAALLDPELVAPCMPGATLTTVDGANFTGTVKVKLGPISLLYKGSGEFLETDEAARKVVIKAGGKDSRGNGTAAATVTVTLAEDGTNTSGTVVTELSITGKPAQFGRGMISEVGGKILDQFAGCLAGKLGGEPAEAGADSRAEAAAAEDDESPAAEPAATRKPEPRTLSAVPEAEPIDLLDYAGASVLKRAAPIAAIALLVLVIVILRRRR